MGSMTFFQMLIEFSKLSDLEKKYLSDALPRPRREFGIKNFSTSWPNKPEFINVEKSLIDKGWVVYRDADYYGYLDEARLEISRDYQDFFRKVQHWE